MPVEETRTVMEATSRSLMLVVCTANETRSPLYAAELASSLARGGFTDIDVLSAGTRARAGRPAHDDVRATARDLGLDLTEHRSRRLTAELVERADLIITAERSHRDEVCQLVPAAIARTFTATELATVLPQVAPATGRLAPRDVAAAVHATRPRTSAAATDLADPTGLGAQAHRALGAEVRRTVAPLVAALLGRPDQARTEVS